MRLQSGQSTCGPTSVSNACKALGVDVSEQNVSAWLDKVRKTENPGVEGTDESQLLRAINEGAPKKHKLRARGWTTTDAGVAIPALRGLLLEGNVAVLIVDADQHWVAAVGIVGRRFLVVDSADPEIALSYTPEQLRARWEVAAAPPRLFAVVLWQEGKR